MTVLHINASPRQGESQSLDIAQTLIKSLGLPDSEVDRIDLFDADLPPFDSHAVGTKMALFGGQEFTPEQRQLWAQIKEYADRFAAADTYVINTPLWNNGIPYILKQYIDLITQPGWNFGFDPETGYTGLLTGRRAFVIHGSGVYYDGIAPNFGSDFATTYLDDWLRFLGITDIQQLRVGPTVVNPDYPATKERAQADAARLATT